MSQSTYSRPLLDYARQHWRPLEPLQGLDLAALKSNAIIERAMNSGSRSNFLSRLMSTIAATFLAMISVIGFFTSEALANTKIDTLRNQMSQIIKLGSPGVLLLLEDGKLRQRMSLGLANLATQRKATTNDAWRIASVTKLVTAAIIIQLVQENRMKLDDRLSAYLPNSVRLADSISIRQLLNHTSGIPDYLSAPNVPLQVSAKRLRANLIVPSRMITLTLGARPFSWHVRL